MGSVESLLLALKDFSNLVLPTLGAIALLVLIVVLVRLCKLITEATLRVKEIEPTLRQVDRSIEKLQAPLDTAVNLAHSVDQAQEKCEKAIEQASAYVSSQLDTLKSHLETMKEERAAKQVQADTNTIQEGENSHE